MDGWDIGPDSIAAFSSALETTQGSRLEWAHGSSRIRQVCSWNRGNC
uniref:Phosphoglycerate kinase n=1 Tax=Arundo donax TaxID=35708 RepID=A0A0A8Z7P8_ARUDO